MYWPVSKKIAIFLSLLPDVLALAAAIGELTSHTRSARTAQWCALQMSLNDMPLECRRAIDASVANAAAQTSSPKQRLLDALQVRDACANMAATAATCASPLAPAAPGDNNNNRK